MSSSQPSLLPNATRDLARFAVETRCSEIPFDVIERIKLSFLDGLKEIIDIVASPIEKMEL